MSASQLTTEIIARHKVLTGFKRFIFFALIAIVINIAESLYSPYKDYYSVNVLSITAILLIISLWLFNKGYILVAKIISAVTFNTTFLVISFHMGERAGTYLYYFPFILAYIYLFRTEPRQLYVWLFSIVSLVFLIVCVVAVPHDPPVFKIPDSKMREIFLVTFFVAFSLTVYFFILIYSYQEKLYNRILELEKNNRIQQLRSVIESHESSNQKLMLELRDNINQTLNASRMFLEKSLEVPNNQTFISKSHDLTNEAIHTLTMLCIRLHPAIVTDVGLIDGIKEFIAAVKKISPIQIEFEHRGPVIEEMNGKDKIAVFRIIQDYLVLLLKNASASRVNIELTYRQPALTLSFSQNDPQFNFTDATHPFKFADINNRITYYKGTVRRRQE